VTLALSNTTAIKQRGFFKMTKRTLFGLIITLLLWAFSFGLITNLPVINAQTPSPVVNPVVNTLDDPGSSSCTLLSCSLRAAIASATDGSTITFHPNLSDPSQGNQLCTVLATLTPPQPCTIYLTSEFDVDKNLTIQGPGTTILTLDGSANTVFATDYKQIGYNIKITDLTIANGATHSVDAQHLLSLEAGGIDNGGNLTINRVYFFNNTAIPQTDFFDPFCGNVGGSGGAISTAGNLSISNSAFVLNHANIAPSTGSSFCGGGGAIHALNMKSTPIAINISNSTFYRNDTANQGGAIWVGSNVNLNLTNVTLFRDQARFSYASAGGEILATNQSSLVQTNIYQPTVIFQNTVIGQSLGGANCSVAGAAHLIDGGHNIQYPDHS